MPKNNFKYIYANRNATDLENIPLSLIFFEFKQIFFPPQPPAVPG